jgi:hypothetical protein
MTGFAGDPGKDVLIDFCGLFQMREVTGIPARDARTLERHGSPVH